MAIQPTLFFGRRDNNALLAAESGWLDQGSAYSFRALTDKVQPQGTGGECLFTALYIAISRTCSVPVTLTVTPLVDGVALTAQTISLAASATRVTEDHKLWLSVPLMVSGSEVARVYARGTWIQVQFDSSTPDDFIIESLEVEWEAVRETKQP